MNYPFIAITPRSTVIRKCNTCWGPIYGYNRVVEVSDLTWNWESTWEKSGWLSENSIHKLQISRQCKTSKHTGEVSTYVIQWTATQRHTNVGRPAKTYIIYLCADTGWRLEDLPRAMADRDGLRGWKKRTPCFRHALMMMMMKVMFLNGHILLIMWQ